MSSTIPDGVKQPEDRKEPTIKPVIADDELLVDLPPLTPPTNLRLRQRNRILRLALSLRQFLPEGKEGEADQGDEPTEINIEDLSDEQLAVFLDVLADVDEFAESIAENKAAYIEWAQKAGYEHFTALLSRYSSAVGESSASSN